MYYAKISDHARRLIADAVDKGRDLDRLELAITPFARDTILRGATPADRVEGGSLSISQDGLQWLGLPARVVSSSYELNDGLGFGVALRERDDKKEGPGEYGRARFLVNAAKAQLAEEAASLHEARARIAALLERVREVEAVRERAGQLLAEELAKRAEALHQRDEALAALMALGVMPDGYCFCPLGLPDRSGHTGECVEANRVISNSKAREPKRTAAQKAANMPGGHQRRSANRY